MSQLEASTVDLDGTGAGTGSADGLPTHPEAWGKGRDATSLALTASSLVLWWWGTSRVEPSAMSDAGLVSVLGWQVFAAFALLGLAFSIAIGGSRPRYLPAGQAVLLVLMVQGIPALAEPHPAYFTAYLHVGFVDEIVRNAHTVPELDARFNWPGAFALGALVTAAGGAPSAMTFLRWAPVFFNLAYLAPLWLIGRSVIADQRARWLALWLFVAANWVHQDYLSPQAVAYFSYLVVIAVVLRYFSDTVRAPGEVTTTGEAPDPGTPRPVAGILSRLRSFPSDLTVVGPPADDAQVRFLLRALTALVAAVVVSHQITPFAIIAVVGSLLVVGRCRAAHLPVVAVVLFAMWFSVGAATWWSSHLGVLFGDVGNVGDNASAGLFGRLGGTDLRAAILWLRVLFSAALFGSALAVATRLARRGSTPITLLAILLPPFVLVAAQSYGGEVGMRTYLFALPAAAMLVAQGLSWEARSVSTHLGTALVAATLTIAAVTGLTVRFGNERFERVTGSDLEAVGWVYENVPHGSVVIAPTRNLPWRYRDLTSYRYEPVDEQPIDAAEAVIELIPADAPAFLIVTDAQQLFGEQIAFLPPGWLDALVAELLEAGHATLVFSQDDAAVYRLDAGGAS